jgi:hypothetical protein
MKGWVTDESLSGLQSAVSLDPAVAPGDPHLRDDPGLLRLGGRSGRSYARDAGRRRNQDSGATVRARRVDFGAEVAAGLTGSAALSSRLALRTQSLKAAEDRMDMDKEYAAVVIPPGFTTSLLAVAGAPLPPGQSPTKPMIELLTNPRAGSLAVGLTTGALTPALAAVSRQLGTQLSRVSGEKETNEALLALREDPLTVTTVQYRPLGSHSALGLSAFISRCSRSSAVSLAL